jgi:hypothetical protein
MPCGYLAGSTITATSNILAGRGLLRRERDSAPDPVTAHRSVPRPRHRSITDAYEQKRALTRNNHPPRRLHHQQPERQEGENLEQPQATPHRSKFTSVRLGLIIGFVRRGQGLDVQHGPAGSCQVLGEVVDVVPAGYAQFGRHRLGDQ